MRRGRQQLSRGPVQLAHRGYLIKEKTPSGFCIVAGGHVIQHHTDTIDDAKRIIDQLVE